MKRLAACTLALILLVLAGFFGAGPARTPSADAQQIEDAPSKLKLDVDELSPRVLTSTSSTLNVSGRITNTGDRLISDVKAQFKLGERQTSERQLGESLAEDPPTDSSRSPFVDVVAALAPGQSAPLSISVPLDDPEGLSIRRPGVFPLLVNVNGTPEYGGPARLAALSTLLPVLSVPGGDGPETPVAPRSVSMLWPIADMRPRIAAAPYGMPVELTDDDLASDLAPGGRLDALVGSAAMASQDPRLASSLCFAIDPDLLDTVVSMTRGYNVRGTSGPVPGQGQEAANRWLDSLRKLTEGRCVIQMPYADADLNTLSRVQPEEKGSALVTSAVSGTPLIEGVLGTQLLPGVLWPDGAMDSGTLGTLGEAGVSAMITDPKRLASESPLTSGVGIDGTGIRAQPFDPLLAAALAGNSGRPQSAVGSAKPADEPDIATQNGLATLAFRTGLGGDADSEPQGAPLLLAPPRHWSAPPQELSRFLSGIGQLADVGMVRPAPLQQLLTAPSEGTAPMPYTAAEVAEESPGEVVTEMSGIEEELSDLGGSMGVDPTVQVDPAALLQPVRNGIVRGSSTVWRGNGSRAATATGDARGQLDAIRSQVRIELPGQVISLASGSSPLPVSVRNELPVLINLRIDLSQATGLRPGDQATFGVPATLSVTNRVPTEALRPGRFSVNVSLTTPSGVTQLGPTARFELTSNEYGAITIIVTFTAAGALLLLSARRIYKRVRAKRQVQVPADYPGPTETVVDAGR
ncbi:DUF6049 family protein [Amycolatopsis antarctica]|uniref:DUF6049 family protein n=1 Tax=Amycolatopsis antarctica TaxID=1854586 RepID=UPI00196B7388|nr:DUF6049 family protein [Amycolatopsis antarctica]